MAPGKLIWVILLTVNSFFRYKTYCWRLTTEEFDVDGVIMHSNPAVVKTQDFAQYALAKEVTKAVGTPVVDGRW